MVSTAFHITQALSTAASVASSGIDIHDCWEGDQSAHLTELGKIVQTVVSGLFAATQTGSMLCVVCPIPNPVQIVLLSLAGGMTVAKQALSFYIGKASFLDATDAICRTGASTLQISEVHGNCVEVAQIVSLLFSATLQISRFNSTLINIVSSDEPSPNGVYIHYDPRLHDMSLQEKMEYQEVFDAVTIADFNSIPALWSDDPILRRHRDPISQQLLRYSTDLEVQREIDQRLMHLLTQTKSSADIRKLLQPNDLFSLLTPLKVEEKSAFEIEQALSANPKLRGLVSSIGVTTVHHTFTGDKSAREAYLIQTTPCGVFKPGKYKSDLLSATAALLGSPFSQHYGALRVIAKNRHHLRVYLAKDASCLSCDIQVASFDALPVYVKRPGQDDPMITWGKEIEALTETEIERQLSSNVRLKGLVASLKVESAVHQFEEKGPYEEIHFIEAKPPSSTTLKSCRADLFSATLALVNKTTSGQEHDALQTVMKSGRTLTICLEKNRTCYSIYTDFPLSMASSGQLSWENMKPVLANLLRGGTPVEVERQLYLTLSQIERCKGVIQSVKVERTAYQFKEDTTTQSVHLIEFAPYATLSLVRSQFDPLFAACALLGFDLDAGYKALHGLAANGERLHMYLSENLEQYEIIALPLAETSSSVRVDSPGSHDPIIAWSQKILQMSLTQIEQLLCSNVKLKGLVAALKVESTVHQMQKEGPSEEIYLIEASPPSSTTVKPYRADLFLATLALLGETASQQYVDALKTVMNSGQLLRLSLAKSQRCYSIEVISPHLHQKATSFSWQKMQPVVATLFEGRTIVEVEKRICLRLSQIEQCRGIIHSIKVEKVLYQFAGETAERPCFLIEATPNATLALFKSKPDLLLVASPLLGFDLHEGYDALRAFAKNGEKLRIYFSEDFQCHAIMAVSMNRPSLTLSATSSNQDDPIIAWAQGIPSSQRNPIGIETLLCANSKLKGLVKSLQVESRFHQFQAGASRQEIYLIEAHPFTPRAANACRADLFLATLALLNQTTSERAYSALKEVIQNGHLLRCNLSKDFTFYSVETGSVVSQNERSSDIDLDFKNLCHDKMANDKVLANSLKKHPSVKAIVVSQTTRCFEGSAFALSARKVEVTLHSSVKERRKIEINALYSAARAVLQSQQPKDLQALSALARDTSCLEMWFSLEGSKKYELSYK